MTPEMNTVGLGGLKKIRGIICRNYLEGKNEKYITQTMQKKVAFLAINEYFK